MEERLEFSVGNLHTDLFHPCPEMGMEKYRSSVQKQWLGEITACKLDWGEWTGRLVTQMVLVGSAVCEGQGHHRQGRV